VTKPTHRIWDMKIGGDGGFSLVELMIVVAIIGVLAATALVGHRALTIRARVTEGIEATAPAKSALLERYMIEGTLPAAEEVFVEGRKTSVLRQIRWSAGANAIEVWFGSGAGEELDDRILQLLPTLLGEGNITWTCAGHSGAPAKRNLPAQYLPSSCRH
jgi:type IV pilus assembly protein PilA